MTAGGDPGYCSLPGIMTDFIPHRWCYLNNSTLIALSVLGDAMVALSYYMIPVAMVALVWRSDHKVRSVSGILGSRMGMRRS